MLTSFRKLLRTTGNNYIECSLNYFIYYALHAAVGNYSSSILQFRGIDSKSIGQIRAVFSFLSIFSPYLCNAFIAKYDYNNHRAQVVRVGICASTAFAILFTISSSFGWFAISLGGFFFLFHGLGSQYEVIVIDTLGTSEYARVRLWGSVGYIFGILVCGQVVETYQAEAACVVILMLCALTSYVTFRLPNSTPTTFTSSSNMFKEQFSLWPVLSARRFILFASSIFLLSISLGTYGGFFIIYLTSLGYSDTQASAALAAGVISELIMFVYAEQVFQTFSPRDIGVVSLAATAFRWYAMSAWVESSALLLLLVQALHALTFSLIHTLCIKFFANHFRG